MINKDNIQTVCESALNESQFIVDVKISQSNVINVFIDSMEGLSVEECKRISRFIESQFDREEEDYALEVSSPGLSKSFKVLKQYEKYLNREVETVTDDGEKTTGILKEANKDFIIIETSITKKIKNKKQLVVEETKIEFVNIKTTKSVISFKQ